MFIMVKRLAKRGEGNVSIVMLPVIEELFCEKKLEL